MNILYINTHDTGRYIQPYGYPVPTPNLMKLAEQGILFRNAYCTAPTCSPSRAGLLTGMMPHNNGMWGLTHRGFSLFDPQKHMACFLKTHGFESILCGIQHEGENPNDLGYETVLDNQDYTMRSCDRDWKDFDLDNARLAADFLRNRPKGKAFFLSYGIFNTHRKFPDIPEAYPSDYLIPPAPLCDTPENRRDMAAFIESAKIMDTSVGIVMKALEDSAYNDDTLVIFTTDHGIAFPEMKGTLYDTGIGVSLIMKYHKIPHGKVSDALVSHLDILPTICDCLNIEKPSCAQGVSLLPLLCGVTDNVRNEIYAESTYHVTYEPKRCVRTQRYKYIRGYSGYNKGMPSNVDDSPDKVCRLQEGFYDWTREPELLFDLYNDPVERVNLVKIDRFKKIKEELSAKLDRWLEKTDDPIRNGIMFPPNGAKVNFPDSPSPSQKVFVENWNDLDTKWNGHIFYSHDHP